jgi:hypothetical protein
LEIITGDATDLGAVEFQYAPHIRPRRERRLQLWHAEMS